MRCSDQENKNGISLKKNFLMNGILSMSSFIFPLITFPYVSRILYPEGIGKVSFAIAVVAYFGMIAQLGIPVYGIRTCAKIRDNRIELSKSANEIFSIGFLMTCISYSLFLLSLYIIPSFRNEKNLFIVVSFSIIFDSLGFEWLYKALEQYTYITVRTILVKIIALIFMFLLVHDRHDYIIYGGITVLASSASSIFNLSRIHRYIDFKPTVYLNLKKHWKPILIFFAMTCAVTVYTNMDTIMLGVMKSKTEVGYYNAAIKIKSVLVSLVTALGAVLLPRSSYYAERKMKKELLNLSTQAVHFVLVSALAIMTYFILFARPCIHILAGNRFDEAVIPMQILMPTVLLIGLTNIMGMQMLVPLGKEKMVLCSEIAGALVDFIINLILIPSLGCVGAAIGTLAAEAVVWIIQFLFLRESVMKIYREQSYGKMFTALLCASGFSMLVHLGNFSKIPTVILSGLIFFNVYFLALLKMQDPLIRSCYNWMRNKLHH